MRGGRLETTCVASEAAISAAKRRVTEWSGFGRVNLDSAAGHGILQKQKSMSRNAWKGRLFIYI